MSGRRGRVTEEERQRIVAALETGASQNSVAKEFGRAPGTVNRIAREADLEYSGPKKANEARRTYAKAQRIEIIEAGMDKLLDLLPDVDAPQQMQPWAMSLAVLLDKRRQEDDEARGSRGSINRLMDALREGDGDDVGTPEG